MRKLAATGARAAELSNWMAGLGEPYGVDKTWRDEIGQRTAEFWRWVREDLGRASLDPAAGPHGRLGYRAQVDGLDLPFPVHIIGLDSAWLAGDDSDQGRLLLTDRQIDMLTCGERGMRCPASGSAWFIIRSASWPTATAVGVCWRTTSISCCTAISTIRLSRRTKTPIAPCA